MCLKVIEPERVTCLGVSHVVFNTYNTIGISGLNFRLVRDYTTNRSLLFFDTHNVIAVRESF